MKIHSICVAKNEVDIIEQTLKSASYWSDFIYVFDNGSTDGTWEKVLDLATEKSQIIPYKQKNCKFYHSLRSEVFKYYRSKSKVGDWWCRLDADEIYIDDPRVFLAKIPQKYQAVWSASFQYYFTDKDLERYNQDASLYADDVSVEQKCRYYLNNWSEMRFLRYDEKLVWDKNRAWPYFGAVYPVRIWLKHYQYRSPQQIQKRISERLKARARGYSGFRHEAQANWSDQVTSQSQISSSRLDPQQNDEMWKERIVDASKLVYDAHDQNYVSRQDLMPKLPSMFPVVVNKLRRLKRYRGFRSILNR